MSLEPGTPIGAYEILSLLGKGGMGEVYRARDAKLERDVAIKLLPQAMTSDPERVARFEREAKLLASLNHSSIAAVYGFDSVDQRRFLALEFVDGETLGQRLARGPLAVEETLELCKQIAEALEAAHERGIVHRDLKPANVMVRPDGTVKVLDFGLAKALGDEPTDSEIANSPTITAEFTKPGIVLGTAAYMSPEQARGRPLDKRTDIWSFGVILFECLSGQTLFRGETATDSMGAIMHRDPDWALLPAETPPTIQLLLRRCLSKNRKRRLHDIADARVEIEEALSDPTGSSLSLAHVAMEHVDEPAGRRGVALGLVVAFLLGAVIAAGAAMALRSETAAPAVRRFAFAEDLEPRHAALSPDGRMVAYVSNKGIYIRDLDSLDHRLVCEDQDKPSARDLFWSPDSSWIGFSRDMKLWKVRASGGEPIQLAETRSAGRPQWTDDGHIVLLDWKKGLVRMPAQGGTLRTFLEPNEDEMHLHGGGVLPEGRGVLFLPHPKGEDARILCVGTYAGERQVIQEFENEIFSPVYSHTGHLIYGQGDAPTGTWALPFSLDTMRATADPFLVISKIQDVSISDTGDLVYTRGAERRESGRQLAWVDRKGEVLERIGPVLFGASDVALSPDGTRAAISAKGREAIGGETGRDLWILDLQRGTAVCLAREEHEQADPAWSPDGLRVAYASMQGPDQSDIVVRNADGSGDSRILIPGAMGFAPDGAWKSALVARGSWMDEIRIERLKIDDPGSAKVFIDDTGWAMGATIRPGGKLVAYLAGDVMEQDVQLFLKRYPEGAGRWVVTSGFTQGMRWNATGDRLFFAMSHDGDRHMMEVAVAIDGDQVTIGEPVKLFSLTEGRRTGFDIALDGERFLMLQPIETTTESEPEEGIVIIQNWYEQFREP